MKNARPNLQRISYNAIQEKEKLYENSPSEARFPSYSLLTIKENALIVHLELPWRQCGRQTYVTALSSTRPDWDSSPRAPTKRLSRGVARCRFAN